MFCTRPTNFLTFFLFFLSLFVFNLNDRNHGGVGSMWHYTDTAKSQNENLFENISKQLDCTARVRPPASTTKHLRTTQRYKKCLVKPSYSNLPLPANDYNRVSLTSWATKREFLLFRYCRNKSRLSGCGKGLSVRNTWKLNAINDDVTRLDGQNRVFTKRELQSLISNFKGRRVKRVRKNALRE